METVRFADDWLAISLSRHPAHNGDGLAASLVTLRLYRDQL